MKSIPVIPLDFMFQEGIMGITYWRPFIMTDNLYEQIAKIEREIARLPEGGIAKKTIKGKDY